jgi:hypothetical protein
MWRVPMARRGRRNPNPISARVSSDRNPPEEFTAACEHIETLIDTIAFSVRDHLVEIEEFFFSLPKMNRQALEYLLVCLAKLDILSRKTKSSSMHQQDSQPGTWIRV